MKVNRFFYEYKNFLIKDFQKYIRNFPENEQLFTDSINKLYNISRNVERGLITISEAMRELSKIDCGH